jgi:hypothetical protein
VVLGVSVRQAYEALGGILAKSAVCFGRIFRNDDVPDRRITCGEEEQRQKKDEFPDERFHRRLALPRNATGVPLEAQRQVPESQGESENDSGKIS